MHTQPLFLCLLTSFVAADLPWYNGRPFPGLATQGGVWPLPWSIKYDDFNHTINPAEFQFMSKVSPCEVIDKAIKRYRKLSFPLYNPENYTDSPATLKAIIIDVNSGCDAEYPQFEMDETYTVVVRRRKGVALLFANQVWGALRGLETFSQLIYQPEKNKYRVRSATIKDKARFPHRGTLIDTARHFLSVSVILEHLDIMAQNKMNVLHWHIVDSESFPYTSARFPNMSLLLLAPLNTRVTHNANVTGSTYSTHVFYTTVWQDMKSDNGRRSILQRLLKQGNRYFIQRKRSFNLEAPFFDLIPNRENFHDTGLAMTTGAYTKAHIYSVADLKKILDYARLRGIRVVPEFDTPGHSGSWGSSFPNLLSKCYNNRGEIDQRPNIIDPTLNSTFDFLSEFFTEALDLFKDNYMHFGGDEVEGDMHKCWENNPDVKKRMEAKGYDNTHKLLNFYWQELFEIVNKSRPGTKKIVWQEVLDLGVDLTHVVAQVWRGHSMEELKEEMAHVTAAGHQAILSSCWYLDYIRVGADWGYVDAQRLDDRGMYYECDPTDFTGSDEQKALVIGGEAALWGEYVDGTNFMPRMWPRASAVAERLWSDPTQTKSPDTAWPRLHEFRCRLMNRGHAAQPPNAPDYCPFEWNPKYEEP